MLTTVNYSTPVTVNGFRCKNCSEVDLAARHVDPAHPQSGPYNVNAGEDPTRPLPDREKIEAAKQAADATKAQVAGYSGTGLRTAATTTGQLVDIRA
jgi:hypothetical protein